MQGSQIMIGNSGKITISTKACLESLWGESHSITKEVLDVEKPELSDCICKMKEVLKGDMTREELSDWAGGYVYADDPEVEDERVWNLLILLSGFDLKDSPETYLHDKEELKDWIEEYWNGPIDEVRKCSNERFD